MVAESLEQRIACEYRCQNTLKNPATFSGIGIHTGKIVSIKFCPAKEGTGIVFQRIDLPSRPIIPATLEYVCDTSRSTTIGIADVHIFTIEHVLAAVRAYNIDNLLIEISSLEPPVGNGSSDVFVNMIEDAGVLVQEKTTPIVKLTKPVYWSEGEIHIVGLPCDQYQISYTLDYPETTALKSQYYSLRIDQENFKKELSPCRTFSRYNEVVALTESGLIKGGSLDNAVIIKDDVIFSKDGLFFPNEMVRHKILDMVGDLSLVGLDFRAHILSIRSGHKSNLAFASELYRTLTRISHKISRKVGQDVASDSFSNAREHYQADKARAFNEDGVTDWPNFPRFCEKCGLTMENS